MNIEIWKLFRIRNWYLEFKNPAKSGIFSTGDPLKRDFVGTNDYKILKHFSFSFTKWGISAPLNIGSEEEISENLNQVIRDNNGDALVNMVVSINSAPVNNYLRIPKVVSFWVGLVSIPLFISDPTRDHAALAAGAIAVYLFTPGVATIKIEGNVVKITGGK